MKIAIMQPYLFPYIGYFSLIKHTDKFILLDDVQFIRHGWIERNRICKQNGGWQYIKVPLEKYSRETLIKDIQINNTDDWKNKIFGQLQHYKKRAPYYFATIALLENIFSSQFKDIVTLNFVTMEAICKYLAIEKPIHVFSNMGLKIIPVNSPDEWALNICKAVGDIDEYRNPPGGKDLFDKSKYVEAGIKLVFQEIELTEYRQLGNAFESGLSIIDVMMFNSPAEINEMLDNYALV